jgi:hypothetical protein
MRPKRLDDFDGLSLGGAWGGPLAFMGYFAAVVSPV